MQALIQRVTRASVSIDNQIISEIGPGLVLFIGVNNEDTEEDSRYLAEKISDIRIFADQTGKFNLSLHETGGEVLVVSQFTLMASTRKGRRPSFTQAAHPEIAEPLIEAFTRLLRHYGHKVETGRFRAYMQVEILNDGPVTIMVDSQDRFKPRK